MNGFSWGELLRWWDVATRLGSLLRRYRGLKAHGYNGTSLGDLDGCEGGESVG